MKRKFFSGLFGLTLVYAALGQTAQFYVNDGLVVCPPSLPPQIDAVNFVNNNTFTINFTNIFLLPPYVLNPQIFDTSSTLNYTNRGTIEGNTGFQFDTAPVESGLRRRANTFYNPGEIDAGLFANLFSFGLAKVRVNATNIINPGSINMGFESLLSLQGRDIDLNRGALTMEDTGFSIRGLNFFAFNGIFDGYWAAARVNGTNLPFLFPNNLNFLPSFTPLHLVTDRLGFARYQQLAPPNQTFHLSDTNPTGSNRIARAVFLSNTNPAVTVNVYFPQGATVVEWRWLTTNSFGAPINNFLYLFDTFAFQTNLQVLVNGASPNGVNLTFKPVNYTFSRAGPQFFGNPAPPGLPAGVFDLSNPVVTNDYTAYEAILQPTSVIFSDVAGQSVTNVPGRIDIVADKNLNLSRTRITSLNSLSIQSSNHFVGSSGASIVSPFADISLRSTNGLLNITNLLAPAVQRPEGTIDLWSGRWTNVVGTITNFYHVLFVDSRFNPLSPARVLNIALRSTNNDGAVILSDILNVTGGFLIESERLTITTNAPGSPTATGGINLLTPDIVWSTATPRLRYLTNDGAIQTFNAVFFGGSRSQPFFNTNFDEPYWFFINRGTVTNFGSLIWATNFMNSGSFFSASGSIDLQKALTAVLTNGSFMAPAPYGDISIASDSLLISNHVLRAGGALTLAVTNYLDDGSLTNTLDTVTNKNTWTIGGGFNLPVPTANASLLGTTVTSTIPAVVEAVSRWAGRDRGTVPEGYTNNAAVGRLILDGGFDSLFTFTGVGASNAIYIDYLELRDYTTNRDASGNFSGLQVDPNMVIYYAQAVAGGVSVAEKMDGKNGGRLRWVSTYAGFYSSTNVVYPDGTTNAFNAALVSSCNIDSDGDGIVNCSDPTPILRAQDLALSVTLLNQPPLTAVVSWQTIPNSLNSVYYKTSLASTNWQLLTNFTRGSDGGRVTVRDTVNPNMPRYYRVRLDKP